MIDVYLRALGLVRRNNVLGRASDYSSDGRNGLRDTRAGQIDRQQTPKAAGCVGGEEDGHDTSGLPHDKLYTTPEDMVEVYEALNPIGRFLFAATFGNVHGSYKPGAVKLKPSILRDGQKAVTDKYGALAPIYGTLVTSLIAMLIAIPVSLGIAIFLTERAPPWMKRRIWWSP